MPSAELATALAAFFEGHGGPSHSELDVLLKRAGLSDYDPARGATGPIGKAKRVRGTLLESLDAKPTASASLAESIVSALRAHGSFRPDCDDYPGARAVESLRLAFDSQGWLLTADGSLFRHTLDGLDGAALTAALERYVQRGMRGHDDDGLLVGNGKDLVEATARHALIETGGSYAGIDFPGRLYSAFIGLGLTPPSKQMIDLLDQDPERAMQQSTWLLAVAENRLRNQTGTGHGHPHTPRIASHVARFAAQASALASRLLLDHLAHLAKSKAA